MIVTYRQLYEAIGELSEEQLDMVVRVYSGDIDESISVFAVGLNTDEEMGESLDNLSPDQPLLFI